MMSQINLNMTKANPSLMLNPKLKMVTTTGAILIH